MASSWKGKTKGGVLGYKIFIYVLKKWGLAPAYFLLKFVSLYYFLFSFKSSSYIYFYFNKILRYSFLKSLFKIYRNYQLFGQTLIDKVAIKGGVSNKFSFHLDGEENLIEMTQSGQGGIMISAHVGNWDVSGHFLNRLNAKINLVIFDAEHENIKRYLKDVLGENKLNVIIIQEDYSHIFHISKALQNKELICMHGDRFVSGAKVIATDFFGRKTFFPYGPFHLATKFKVPYTYVFGFKETSSHYHFYSTPLKVNSGKVRPMVREYAQKIESLLKLYLEQWFNYYDFWATPSTNYIVEE